MLRACWNLGLTVLLVACGGRSLVDLSAGAALGCEPGDPGCEDGAGAGGASGEGGGGRGGRGGRGGAGGIGESGTGVGGFGAFGGAGAPGGSGAMGGDSGGGAVGGTFAGTGSNVDECQPHGHDVDITCPDSVGPFDGPCAPRGECCRRSSNAAELAWLQPDEPHTLEYRINAAAVVNHPQSLSLPVLQSTALERARACGGDQCRLIRLVRPRSGGEYVEGHGTSQHGIGQYNCDGTYSFYSTVVAPVRPLEGLTDPSRWASEPADTHFLPSASGASSIRPRWSTDPSRRVSCAPFFLPGTQEIDFEQCWSGFELLDFDGSSDGMDCQGLWSGSSWTTPGRYQVFAPLEDNDRDTIDSISQSFCQLLSFSVLPPDERDRACLALPRCEPGSAGCDYVKLPDSLCPVTDAESSLFRCHLGALGNPNDEPGYPSDAALGCTMGAPVEPQDPDLGVPVSKGQCCDPLGLGAGGLPACNAFRLVYEFAASAAEIRDAHASQLPPVCF